MILQALSEYYKELAARGECASYGWGTSKASFALNIDASGTLESVISIMVPSADGEKMIPRTFLPGMPNENQLPQPVKRTSGIAPNFLCDNSSYILGVDSKSKPRRAIQCFETCKALHQKILAETDSPAARALLAFFQNWEPESAREHPALTEQLDDILSGANLIFRYNGMFVHDDPAIRQAWERHYGSSGGEGEPEMVCLVTGEKGPTKMIHPAIKGVQGAQSSGAALVSFNAPAFCSYGKEQNLNAPTSKAAAFAYTTALNHLLSDRELVYRIGDATVVFWAKSGERAYQSAFASFSSRANRTYEEQDLRDVVKELCRGHKADYDGTMLDPNMEFYILGLSPNAARLSVRFFLRNSFGAFLQNLEQHRERLKIVRPPWEKYEVPSLKVLLDATVNKNSKSKDALPALAGEVLRAALNNTAYPATLLNGVNLRIRAEHEITWARAAIIKAYYIKNPSQDVPEEVLKMSLNEDSPNPYYTLGRLFSVLEAIQQSANPGINSTIKDKYFNSASATPATVFPVLINLAQKHLKKLSSGQAVYFSKQLQAIMDKLPEEFPARLSLPQQGAFQLGYYHQTQARYEKKEDKQNV